MGYNNNFDKLAEDLERQELEVFNFLFHITSIIIIFSSCIFSPQMVLPKRKCMNNCQLYICIKMICKLLFVSIITPCKQQSYPRCNAKYLWKRIPADVKIASPDLGHIWTVAQHMWKKDFPEIYKALHTVPWPETVSDIMKQVEGTLFEIGNRNNS